MIFWFTGQPGAGKTTLAKKLVEWFSTYDKKIIHIDGDDLRQIFDNKDYSEEGRKRNIQRAQDIAKFMYHKGFVVIVSLVSPYRTQREELKNMKWFYEVFVHTNEIRGRESFHVNNYEPPLDNFIDVDTTNQTEEESLKKIINQIIIPLNP